MRAQRPDRRTTWRQERRRSFARTAPYLLAVMLPCFQAGSVLAAPIPEEQGVRALFDCLVAAVQGSAGPTVTPDLASGTWRELRPRLQAVGFELGLVRMGGAAPSAPEATAQIVLIDGSAYALGLQHEGSVWRLKSLRTIPGELVLRAQQTHLGTGAGELAGLEALVVQALREVQGKRPPTLAEARSRWFALPRSEDGEASMRGLLTDLQGTKSMPTLRKQSTRGSVVWTLTVEDSAYDVGYSEAAGRITALAPAMKERRVLMPEVAFIRRVAVLLLQSDESDLREAITALSVDPFGDGTTGWTVSAIGEAVNVLSSEGLMVADDARVKGLEELFSYGNHVSISRGGRRDRAGLRFHRLGGAWRLLAVDAEPNEGGGRIDPSQVPLK